MNNLVAYLRNNNVKFGTLWLDVEQCTGCWSTNLASNFQVHRSRIDHVNRYSSYSSNARGNVDHALESSMCKTWYQLRRS